MRRLLPRFVAAAFALISLGFVTTPHATAQELVASTALGAPIGLPEGLANATLFPVASVAKSQLVLPTSAPDFSRVHRPALLPALYASSVALQALDAHSTLTALKHGAREANPMMQGVAGNPTALIAVKAGAAVGTIYFAEKLWRRNRVAAVALMTAVNGVSAIVVAHNYKVASRLR